jgi:hypothetical protein
VLELSTMKYYLAHAVIEPYLATLPELIEYDAHRRGFAGDLGERVRSTAEMKEAPHQVFVNWPDSDEAIGNFTRNYGLLDPNGKNSRCYFDVKKNSRKFFFRSRAWREQQKYFRQYWDWNSKHSTWDVVRSDMASELTHWQVVNAPELSHPGLEVSDIRNLGKNFTIVLEAGTLWQYLCTLLAFQNVGELRRCGNPDCPAPRFIAKRKDQIFCTSDCAALIAKRRWWSVNGANWRKNRKEAPKNKRRK